MTDDEKLRRDIDTLRDSIRQSWMDMANLPLTKDQRRDTRLHVAKLIEDLAALIARLDANDA